jgi:tetratricopeptide (TPR) repeat protein
LCDHLNTLVGADRVFMDFEDIAPGQRFAQTIDETIARCDTALIVIGPRWAEILQKRAQDQQLDYVRREIEGALARQITIVPVLVGGASMAQLVGLPDKLAALSQYEAAELRDSTFKEDCVRLANALRSGTHAERGVSKVSRYKRLIVAIGVTALMGLLLAATGWMGVGPLGAYRARKAAIEEMFATARTQTVRADYAAAFKTYQNLLKMDPRNPSAMDLQLNNAMRWLENFQVTVVEGRKVEDLAAALLDEITPILDTGLARTSGPPSRVADIMAHIGWGRWLNSKLAYRGETGAAERDLRQALVTDPSNVFAHAMLGNVMMQTGGKTDEALRHFRIAGEQNRERPFVRRLELGAMIYPHDGETRLELIRVANDMRRNGEPLNDRERSRILTTYNPTVNSAEEIKEALSAVPPADAWATYIWLDEPMTRAGDVEYQRLRHDFIQASLLEMEGKREAALAAFENLQGELKRRKYNGRIVSHVDTAIKRLSMR